MWFKQNKRYFFIATLSSAIVAFFGCSYEPQERASTGHAEEFSSKAARKSDDIKINVLLKDQGRELNQSADAAPAMDSMSMDVPQATSQATTNAQAYGYSMPGAYGAQGLPIGEGYGNGLYGAGAFGVPWFDAGFPYYPIVLDDDDDSRRHHEDRDVRDDDSNDDEENRVRDDDDGNISDDDVPPVSSRDCGRCGVTFPDL